MTDATTTTAAPASQIKAPFTLDSFKDIFSGKVSPPNFRWLELSDGVAALCLAGWRETGTGYLRAPDSTHPQWARFYLGTTQGGFLDGSCYAMMWTGAGGKIGSFALCQHQSVEGASANHSRGWHPARCAKCGLDLSVDSGD